MWPMGLLFVSRNCIVGDQFSPWANNKAVFTYKLAMRTTICLGLNQYKPPCNGDLSLFEPYMVNAKV